MSEKLPRVTADQMIRVVSRLEFVLVRQSGSHKIFRNAQGTRLTIPYHKGKILHPKLVRTILRDVEISEEEFRRLI